MPVTTPVRMRGLVLLCANVEGSSAVSRPCRGLAVGWGGGLLLNLAFDQSE